MIQIDGRKGEGGGQVLRTALALSACLNRPFRIAHIRAGRRQPGLKAQHLAAVSTVARISGAAVEGAELGSATLRFAPGALAAGEYEVAVGTAGATTLVAQAALLPLLHAPGPSRLRIDGGTHVAWSPPFEHTADLLLPLLASLGYPTRSRLERLGFYPRGGGRIEIATEGGRGKGLPGGAGRAVAPERLTLLRPPRAAIRVRVTALVSSLPRAIAERMVRTASALLADHGWNSEERVIEQQGPTGTYVFISVAREAAQAALAFLASDASLDTHLADQILAPAALSGVELEFRTERISNHLRTNAEVAAHFLGPCVEIEASGRVRVAPSLRQGPW